MAEGFGRGGRGARILEALKNEARRPGASEAATVQEVSDNETPMVSASPTIHQPCGRGSLIAALLAQRSSLSENEVTPVTSATSRGIGLTDDAGSSTSLGRGRLSDLGAASTAALPLSVGRGRAAVLQSLRKNLMTATTSTPVTESSPKIQQISSKLAAVDINPTKEPVVKIGKHGESIPATANYIRLIMEPGKGVFEYEVRFEPGIDSKSIRTKLLSSVSQQIGGCKTYDGHVLYLPIKLEEEVTVISANHPVDNTPVNIQIIFKKQKRMGDCIHMYNILFRRIMNILEMARIGRHNYNPMAGVKIPQHKLEVWPGFITAVDEYEGGIQLCCDSSHRVLRTQTVLDILSDCISKDTKNYRDHFQKMLIGTSVLTRYNNKIYRVDDIAWNQKPSDKFDTQSGHKISFMDYYKKQYDLDINDPDQPLLISKVKKTLSNNEKIEQLVCLVPELSYMTGLTDAMRNDYKVMKDIAMYTRITPNQRQAALRKFIDSVNGNEKAKALLADWGLHIESETVNLPARIVNSEAIIFGNNVRCKGTAKADWSADVTRNVVISAVDLTSWVVVHTTRDTRFCAEFEGMMQKVGPQMGIRVCKPNIVSLRDDRTESYLRALRDSINPQVQVVVIIFPTSRDDRYAAVKKLCCAEIPIASQVINSKTLSKPDKLRSVVQKIALQINCKLGGTLWAVHIPMDNVMVCGIDSYHDSTKRQGSVAAFVASLNKSMTRWYSRVCFQGPQQELVDGLRTCFTSSLKKYYEVNHRFPERIIIYRDGVGDGQLKISQEYEVPQFSSCFLNISPDYNPKLTFIVCQKRINTRIFANLHRSFDNPPPGTIVDSIITRRWWYDFFLVSQNVRQGTVSPTHYVVIHDTSNMEVDHVQRLTYKLCHLYYNWPGTVRVPAPCQYAHKLAQLVGQSIRREPSDQLADRLYFL